MRIDSKIVWPAWALLVRKGWALALLVGLLGWIVWSEIHNALRRRELVAATDRLAEAIERGRRFSAANNAIITAHFSLGTDRWSVATGAADLAFNPSSALALRLGPSADEAEEATWRFLAFRSLSGEPASPSLVFFPDGEMQGGEVELGWRDVRRRLRMGPSGRIDSRFVAPARRGGDEHTGPPLYYEK